MNEEQSLGPSHLTRLLLTQQWAEAIDEGERLWVDTRELPHPPTRDRLWYQLARTFASIAAESTQLRDRLLRLVEERRRECQQFSQLKDVEAELQHLEYLAKQLAQGGAPGRTRRDSDDEVADTRYQPVGPSRMAALLRSGQWVDAIDEGESMWTVVRTVPNSVRRDRVWQELARAFGRIATESPESRPRLQQFVEERRRECEKSSDPSVAGAELEYLHRLAGQLS